MKLPGKTLVCFALGSEQRAWNRLRPPDSPHPVMLTGIGRINARTALDHALASSRPSRVFTCGFAGALNPGVGVAEVLYETTDPSLAHALQSAGARSGRFLCLDRIASTAKEKQDLWVQSKADAVEMESAAIHEACASTGVSCATLRAISDAAGDDLPLDFNRLMDSQMRLRPSSLAGAILRRPWKIPALIRLGKQSARAAEELAAVLHRVL